LANEPAFIDANISAGLLVGGEMAFPGGDMDDANPAAKHD
jgi:hypothetical protein